MAVTAVHHQTGQTLAAKFASVKDGTVSLWSGGMVDKKGGFRGCGKKIGVFLETELTLHVDDPEREFRRS